VPEASQDVVLAGRAELGAARWAVARALFEAALADQETPEAFEGLSWAAWWVDDAAAVRHAREQAYRLYRQAGDAAGAARLATWIAADALDFDGAVAVANGWLQRAHRLLDGHEPVPEHGWLAFHEGYIAHAGGDAGTAQAQAVATAALGRRFGVADLEMLGLALEGAALVASVRVPEGMDRLDEATALALEGEAAIPISAAWTCCFLVSACTAVLDYERAAAWCDRIADFADRYGSRYMLAFCRAEYGAVHLWRGRWEEADALLGAAVEDFAASRPAYVGAPLGVLAELRRRQGRIADALALLDRLGSSSAALLCRARLALDTGDVDEAIALLERLLRSERRVTHAPAYELLARGHAARGATDAAAAAVAALRELAVTRALRACADRAEGVLAAARGDRERARTLLEDAADAFEACGAPYEAAEARRLLASPAALPQLSPREREVLHLLAEGLTNAQIAERLVISEHTVHRHVANILRKLGVASRTAAAAHAVRAGV
jgi:LuxR family transcriptional regulator, maltose regulon positive regulatory protein